MNLLGRKSVVFLCVLVACGGGEESPPPATDLGATLDLVGLPDPGPVNDMGEQGDLSSPSEDTSISLDLNVVKDVAPLVCEGESGCFQQPCVENSDCFWGHCVVHLGEKKCSEPCEQDCGEGWQCGLIGNEDFCISRHPQLCMPCIENSDCGSENEGSTCVAYGDTGSFCGSTCATEEDCPEGYRCDSFEGSDNQCVQADGVCACTDLAISDALLTSCAQSNDFGSCSGTRMCQEGGLSLCDAKEPLEDTCNGVDDDCDGVTDELINVLGEEHNAGCATDAACVASGVTAQCVCNPGFSGDGLSCSDVDECVEGTDLCDANASCTNTVGGHECACNPGYEGDGQACIDVDECALDTDNCHPDASCTNNTGSFDCACNVGFEGDGESCVDLDECVLETAGCDGNATCTNTVGSFACDCNAGHVGDGFACVDTDECSNGSITQPSVIELQSLTTSDGKSLHGELQLPGGPGPYPVVLLIHQFTIDIHQWDPYLSSLHDLGFATFTFDLRGHGSSDDYDGNLFDLISDPNGGPLDAAAALNFLVTDPRIDHSRIGVVGTSIGANLVYVLSAPSDSAVRAGVALSPRNAALFSMLEISNSEGLSFSPTFCLAGAQDSLGQQADTCLELQPLSSPPSEVEIVPDSSAHGLALITEHPEIWPMVTSYLAEAVLGDWQSPAGHDCDVNAACTNSAGSFSCSCNAGFEGSGTECLDLDECTLGSHDCHADAQCTNIPGAFECTCNAGYGGSGTECVDLDECILETHDCDSNASCTNGLGSFSCACNEGYEGSGTVCTDLDECLLNTDDCDVDATCTNDVGGFSCACNSGFEGSGTECLDLDECILDTHDCDANAACNNTVGSFSCACNAGFTGSGTECSDVDECDLDIHDCSLDATCSNTEGSFDCTCNIGYEGSGTLCEDIDECFAGTDACDPNATCVNNPGNYACDCNVGFEGDGLTCTDIDECALSIDDCPSNHYCVNLPGSFQCNAPLTTFVSSGKHASTAVLFVLDAQCQADASSVGLSGTFKAWRSESFSNNVSSTVERKYQRIDGQVIAEDWADLTDGSIGVPLNLKADGSQISTEVWTGLMANGNSAVKTCDNWSSMTSSGVLGYTEATNDSWTNQQTVDCFDFSPTKVGTVTWSTSCGSCFPGSYKINACGFNCGSAYEGSYGCEVQNGSCQCSGGYSQWMNDCYENLQVPLEKHHYCFEVP